MSHPTVRSVRSSRWGAVGAAVAIVLAAAGGLGLAEASESASAPVTVTITPRRILDTRVDLGLSGVFADATPRELRVTGSVAVAPSGTAIVVPVDATAVLVNTTVVRPTHPGFLSLRPGGATGTPTTSTVNFGAGTIEPNAATVALAGGKVQIWLDTEAADGTAHVLLDVVGYTIDHEHDDRYYTKAESDLRYVTSEEFSDTLDGLLPPYPLEPALSSIEARLAILETAQPFAVGARGGDSIIIGGAPATAVSVSLTAPVAGTVIVNSSAAGQEGGVGEGPFCSITTGTNVDYQYLQAWQSDGQGTSDDRGTLAGTRPFIVTADQQLTVNLVCQQGFSGTSTMVHNPVLTAIFTPAP